MKEQFRTLSRGIEFRILVPVVGVVFTGFLVIYLFAFNAVELFINGYIGQVLEARSTTVTAICDQGFASLLNEGNLNDARAVRIRKAHTIDRLEEFAAQHDFHLVISENARQLLNTNAFSGQDLARLPALSSSPSPPVITDKSEQFHFHAMQYEPWNWQITLFENSTKFHPLMARLEQISYVAWAAFFLAVLLLVGAVRSFMIAPLRKLVTSISQGNKPEYRGIREFEFLSESLAAALSVSEQKSRDLAAINQQLQQESDRRMVKEKLLQESEEDNMALLNATLESAMLIDAAGNILALNQVAADRLGQSRGALIGKCAWDLVPPEMAAVRRQVIDRAIQTREPVRHLDERDGLVLDAIVYPVVTGEAPVTRLAVFAADISQRRSAEQALQQSEEKFHELTDMLPQVVFELDDKGNLSYVNDYAFELFGVRKENFISGELPVLEFIAPEDRTRAADNMRRAFAGEPMSGREYLGLRPDGTRFPILAYSRSFTHNGRVGLRGLLVDITRRKNEEKLLLQAHDNLEQKVAERTAELIDVVETLEKVVMEYRLTARELENKSRDLEELNTALQVLLRRRDREKAEFEQEALASINSLVLPQLNKFRSGALDEQQRSLLDLVEMNLLNIIAPGKSGSNLATFSRLTPTEIQVANLIRQRKTSREIASLLQVSIRTVDAHRNNIRKKIGIVNKGETLSQYLQSTS